MVYTEIPNTAHVSQPDTAMFIISPLLMENWFHPLFGIDGESDTKRITKNSPPPTTTTLGHFLVARFCTVLRKVGE